MGHGAQKLMGWFGGHGVDGTAGFFESLGLRPGRRQATAAGATETVGGALLIAGAATPLATAMLTATMVTAIRKVHAVNGPWNTDQGWEFNATIIAALTALAETGPGSPALQPHLRGRGLALASLAAGVAGSYLVTDVLNEAPAQPDSPAAGADATAREPELAAA